MAKVELRVKAHFRNTYPVQGAMLSDLGRGRVNNEDRAVYVIPKEDDSRAQRGVIALVADGMGGHAGGDIASSIAAEAIVKTYYECKQPPNEALLESFQQANAAIYGKAQATPEHKGMGTTCTALVLREGYAFLAHVGDSRLYLLRGDSLYQLSEDHSLVMELVRAGAISRVEAQQRPDRNVLVRALGTHPNVEVSVWREGLRLQPKDVFLLCSDGLTDLVEDEAIKTILLGETPFDACRALITAALCAGGTDNVTVGVFTIDGDKRFKNRTTRITRLAPIPFT